MTIMNGIESAPPEWKGPFEDAGLKLVNFWETRSMVGILEAGL